MHPSKSKFFKEIYTDNEKRVVNQRLLENDFVQWEKNQAKKSQENALQETFISKARTGPLVFILGVPRSGTTLLTQLILNSFDLGAFYNSVAKYYAVPLYGLRKQLSERSTISTKTSYHSKLGHAAESFALHEFRYFWQYWLNHEGHDELNRDQKSHVNWEGLRNKINAYHAMLGKGLLIKSLVFNDFIVKELSELFPDAKFIHMSREAEFVSQSLLESRVNQYNDIHYWWSIKPRNWQKWQSLDTLSQVMHQTVYTDFKIQEQISRIEKINAMHISYEELVEDVPRAMLKLATFLNIDMQEIEEIKLIKNANLWRLDTFSIDEAIETKKEVKTKVIQKLNSDD